MMWKRVTKAAGFCGLLAGTVSSVTTFLLMQGKFPLVPAQSSERWISLFALSPEAKGLAQDMYQSLWSCVTCVVVTVLVTMVTKPRPDAELHGLVYSLTEKAKEEHASLLHRPAFWGVVSLVVLAILQIIFW
jgi:solute:Na+ symporter, SSS family